MRPSQLALLHSVLDAALAACLAGPVATLESAHLRALLLERLLRDGGAVLEPSGEPGRGRLLRLVDDVVRVERAPLPPRPPAAGSSRPPRPPDLRLVDPERLDLEVHARSTLAQPPDGAGRALLERLGRVAARTTDALILACDRRSYDALRRAAAAGAPAPAPSGAPVPRRRTDPPVLGALCAAVLPPSAALAADFGDHEADVGAGQLFVASGAVTPMVFGVQRVVVAVRLRAGAGRAAVERGEAQLDAFAGGAPYGGW